MQRVTDRTKQLRGTYRRDRARDPGTLRGLRCHVPAWLGADAAWLWRYLAPRLRAQGRLAEVDRPAFEMLCCSYGMAREAMRSIAQLGIVVEDASHCGVKKNPAVQVYKDATAQFMALAGRFGLTPSDRQKLPGLPAEQETFADFMNRLVENSDHEYPG